MKHGDKTKAKASKASGKKASQSVKTKSGKAVTAKASPKSSSKSVPKSAAKGVPKSEPKVSAKAGQSRDNGTAARGRTAPDGFSNPAVAAAFKHAVKKYSNAFRKLTD
ncbi:MAG TPA: hypothetical protein VFT12_09925 [Thermoanaerobaculia bacterium]|nr:hypothetical protein [Thermoanaerobaculia bacterium]